MPVRGRDLFLFVIMSILALEPTHSSIQWVLEALSPGVEWPGHETYQSPPSSVKVKIVWSCTSTPPYAVMVWYLVKLRDSFTLLYYNCFSKLCLGGSDNILSSPKISPIHPLKKCYIDAYSLSVCQYSSHSFRKSSLEFSVWTSHRKYVIILVSLSWSVAHNMWAIQI